MISYVVLQLPLARLLCWSQPGISRKAQLICKLPWTQWDSVAGLPGKSCSTATGRIIAAAPADMARKRLHCTWRHHPDIGLWYTSSCSKPTTVLLSKHITVFARVRQGSNQNHAARKGLHSIPFSLPEDDISCWVHCLWRQLSL